MPILSGDIQLLAAERLADNADGGGRMTGQVIVDGKSNNLFADISEIDRTIGRVSLRKCYLGVLTDSVEPYYGSHVIVASVPTDPRVSVTLFSTRSWSDRRNAAQDRIERYLARGVRWQGQLLERQLSGQRAIALLQKPGDPLPRIGQTLALVQDEGKSTEFEQFVRVTRVTTVEREFTVADAQGVVKFRRVVVTCELADPLRRDFEGPPPSPRDDVAARAVIRDTVVANAAVYYGIQPTLAHARLGDLRVQVASLYTQLVPSAQAETPLVDLAVSGAASPVIASGTGTVSWSTSVPIGPNRSLYLGGGCLPGSLRITVTGAEIVDDAGQLKVLGTAVGTLDYGSGQLTFAASCPPYDGWKTVSFRPAVAPFRVTETAAISIRPENRGYTYTLALNPPPAPGSLMVSYMAQGQWVDLYDRGPANGSSTGALRGSDAAFGAGSIDYVTGSAVITCGALPDAGTELLFAWGTGTSYFNRANVELAPPAVTFTTANPGIVPGTLELGWTDGTNSYTAKDDGHGQISGDATGTVGYARGEVVFRPKRLPAGGAEITVRYQFGPPLEEVFAKPARQPDGTLALTLSRRDVRPGMVELEFNLAIENYTQLCQLPAEMQLPVKVEPIKVVRDAAGRFDGAVDGTIDYAAGTLSFKPETTVGVPVPRYRVRQVGTVLNGSSPEPVYRTVFERWEYLSAGAQLPRDDTAYVKVRYRAADAPNQATEIVTVQRLTVDLTPRYNERIVGRSVRFTLGGKHYVDRQGSLFTDVDPATGAGTLAGTLDYASGRAELTVWTPGGPNTAALQSLLTELAGQPVDEVTFRLPAAPLRSGSVQLRATALTGGLVSATANGDGSFQTAQLTGKVDHQTGIARVRFGAWVPAAGNEGQPWYSPEAVVDGKIFKPRPVLADSIRCSAVAYRYLPLPADILGLDPVRLPADGRVPIYRPGDVVVVHHAATTPFPVNAKGGDQLDVGRVRLSRLVVRDSAGKALPGNGYQTDLDAGRVTLAPSLDLSGFTVPLIAEHRVQDLALVSDAQINGVLSLTRPLTHDYPAGTLVSSALIVGDLAARAHTLFAQQAWTGEWADSRIGANTTAQYNATQYPIEVSNRGAAEERWALIFTSTTEYRVIGEAVGQIAVGNTATDLAPINPAAGVPYFHLGAAGFGSGWSAGNVLRFNTAAANFPLWLARTVLQGPSSQDASFHLEIRGDVGR